MVLVKCQCHFSLQCLHMHTTTHRTGPTGTATTYWSLIIMHPAYSLFWHMMDNLMLKCITWALFQQCWQIYNPINIVLSLAVLQRNIQVHVRLSHPDLNASSGCRGVGTALCCWQCNSPAAVRGTSAHRQAPAGVLLGWLQLAMGSAVCAVSSGELESQTARQKEAPNPHGSHNAVEAARQKEAPNPRGLHNTFEAARQKEAPNPRGLLNTCVSMAMWSRTTKRGTIPARFSQCI